jgi:hypothetical protein
MAARGPTRGPSSRASLRTLDQASSHMAALVIAAAFLRRGWPLWGRSSHAGSQPTSRSAYAARTRRVRPLAAVRRPPFDWLPRRMSDVRTAYLILVPPQPGCRPMPQKPERRNSMKLFARLRHKAALGRKFQGSAGRSVHRSFRSPCWFHSSDHGFLAACGASLARSLTNVPGARTNIMALR